MAMRFLRTALVALVIGLTRRSIAIKLCHMMYMNADNDLEDAIVGDAQELLSNSELLARAGYSLHIMIDRHAEYSTAVLTPSYDSSGAKRTSENQGAMQYTYTGGKLTQVTPGVFSGEVNMDSSSTLEAFLKDVLTRCKAAGADKFFLMGSSHGVGWAGFGGDEMTRRLGDQRRLDGSGISNKDFAEAVRRALAANAIDKLDMLGFDACLMSSVSTMRAFQGITKYLLGSEPTEPGHGWDYTLLRASYNSVVELGKNIIDTFTGSMQGYEHQAPKMLTLLNLAAYPALETKLGVFFDLIKGALDEGDQSVFTAVSRAIDSAQRFQGAEDTADSQGKTSKSAVDLGDFLLTFEKGCPDGSLKTAREELLAAYKSVIVHFALGEGSPKRATGIHIWMPTLRAALDSELQFYNSVMCSSAKHSDCSGYLYDHLPEAIGNFMEKYYANDFEPVDQTIPRCSVPKNNLPSAGGATNFGMPSSPPSADNVAKGADGCYAYPTGSLINAGQIHQGVSMCKADVLVDELVISIASELAVEVPSKNSHAILQEGMGKFDANKVSVQLPKYVFTVDGSAVTAFQEDESAELFEVDVFYFPPGTAPVISNNKLTNPLAGKLGSLQVVIDSNGGVSAVSLYAITSGSLAAVQQGQGKVVPLLHMSSESGWTEHVYEAVDWATGFKSRVRALSFDKESAWTSVGMAPSSSVSVEVTIHADTEKSASTPCFGEVYTTDFEVTVTKDDDEVDDEDDDDDEDGSAHAPGAAAEIDGSIMSARPVVAAIMGGLPLIFVSLLTFTLPCLD